MNNNILDLLKRTPLNIPFESFLDTVLSQFPSLGKIIDFQPINEGYEDANIVLQTSNGKFVLKIFFTERSLDNINSYVKILNQCKQIGIQTTEILTDFNNGLGFVENSGIKAYYIITKFFEGDNFLKSTPSLKDIEEVTKSLTKLNTLDFKVAEAYDSWGNKNFGHEYEENKGKITAEQDLLIKSIYHEFIKLDLDSFSQSVIHGDMQRKHVLKSKDEKYCIFDFGCMAKGPKVIELSTYLAWFCLQDDTWNNKDKIINLVLDIYNKTHNLTQVEIDSLTVLTKASWAAYYLRTSVMIKEGDTSEETLDWHNKAKTMLILSKKWR